MRKRALRLNIAKLKATLNISDAQDAKIDSERGGSGSRGEGRPLPGWELPECTSPSGLYWIL